MTVGDILDKIALVRDQLDVVRIQDHFGPGGDELLELMGGRNLYVIPFAMLCTINSNIGNSR
ncbi:hypothetical protein AWC11_11385 [Mycobacterium interjectum]|nr:hypothetical protein AWC11_11385 [Mycobacterium interjectum]